MTDPSSPSGPPPEITHLVRERMEARARQDWPAADALKARIEALGWRVTDHGKRSSAGRAAPTTIEVAGEPRYGSAAAVASLLDEPATSALTVAVVASEAPDQISRLLAAIRAHAPDGTQVVVVADDPSDAQASALRPKAPDVAPIGAGAPEVLRTSVRLGSAAALNIGLRRATGEIVIVADGSAWPTGDAFSPLAAALADPAVAAVGGFGLSAPQAGRFRPNSLERSAGSLTPQDVAALEAGWLAFRRSDYRALGPLDEHFVTPAWLDVWWTLRLRAGAEPSEADELTEADEAELPPARRAIRLELPLARGEVPWPPDRSRLNRRNMYLVLDRFGWRHDLT